MSQDTLSDVLRAVRLRGAVFFYVDGTPPWVVGTPAAQEITPDVHARRATWWNRMRWRLALFLVVAVDYSVNRRFNLIP